MTNYLPDALKKKQYITPERAVIFIPILSGIFIAALLGIFALNPLNKNKSKEYSELLEHQRKAKELPIIFSRLQNINKELDKANKKQQKIIELIAGESQIKTFYSQLNQIISKYDVNLKNIVPDTEKIFIPTTADLNAISDPDDPLLIKEIKRYSTKITLTGGYLEILEVLRKLELLEVISLPYKMTINSSKIALGTKEDNYEKIKLILNLYTYGRIN